MREARIDTPSHRSMRFVAACVALSAASALAQLPPLKPQAAPQIQAPQLKPLVTGYTAEIANAGFQGSANAGGVAWQCAAGRCSASGPVARPTVQVCSELVRTVGALRSFAYGQSALGPNELGQCNAAVAAAPKPRIGPLPQAGMMPQGPMGAAPQAPALPLGTPLTPPGTPSSAGPGLKRAITADDFAPLTPPLPAAPQRVTPPTPGTKPPGTQAIADPAQKPIVSAAPLMAMPELKPGPAVQQAAKPEVKLQAAMTPATPDPAKKPPGAKGTPQASAQGDGKASPPSSAAAPPPAGPFSPVAVRTPQLTLTGIGVAEISYRFTPIAVRTPRLTLTGIGVAEMSFRFTPVAVRTPQLTLTGTGRSE